MMKYKYSILGGLCVVASVVMFVVGSNSSHLSELADFFWVPLPLAAVSFALCKKCNNKCDK